MDAAHLRIYRWRTLCFCAGDCCFALATFVGNLLTTATAPEQAIHLFKDCEKHLASRWEPTIGADSKDYSVCRDAHRHTSMPDG